MNFGRFVFFFLTRDFRYFFYPPHSFSNMTHIQKQFVQVACRYPASYRQHKRYETCSWLLP